MRCLARALLVILILAVPGRAPAGPEPPAEEKGTYLGVLVSPVPEAVLDQAPQLPRDHGVLVTHVLPDSPAARCDLRRHDLLLEFDGEKVKDGSHLVRLIQASKPNQTVRLGYARAGREATVRVKLGLGPVLTLAGERRALPGVAKPVGPAAVSVTALPVEGNRLKITFEYADAGRYCTRTCAGDAAEIDRQIGLLPTHIQAAARVAIGRLRELKLQ